jgi:hypothetical protein
MADWSAGTPVAVGLAAFLLGWYVVGLCVTRRRAAQALRQLRDSLQSLGGEAAIGWIGRSAFRVEARKVRAPLIAVSIDLRLEPRETFLVWIVGRWLGRRDRLSVTVSLDGAAKGAFDIYHPRRQGAGESARDVRALGWRAAAVPSRPDLLCAAPGSDDRSLAEEALNPLRGLDVWRVRLRPDAPQLAINVPILPSETRVPLPVVQALPAVARAVLSPRAPEAS